VDTIKFWDKRAIKYGHTGWSDFAIYHYDQLLRIKTIIGLIANFECKEFALDYGCGIGDFANSLSNYYKKIDAVDISPIIIEKAEKINKRENINYTSLSDFEFISNKYNLILSITVIQHIMDKNEYEKTIKNFYYSLQKDGYLVLLESIAKKENNLDYIILRELETIKRDLKSIGFKNISEINFYHPNISPTKLYQEYNNKYIIKILSKMCKYRIPFSMNILSKFARSYVKNDNGIMESDSVTKILIFKK
jgi:2-polyprenyl-3-methyl-5-hydroxy-6-metoxy-1,4-benzoquinol methylase